MEYAQDVIKKVKRTIKQSTFENRNLREKNTFMFLKSKKRKKCHNSHKKSTNIY